ncbi:hypothetical protein AA313_de0200320 [Arthrobotrys entomopaga]|nr:hypothetical protein AA313_de0200320 [Arthrobotrys entomopaga]
MSTKPGNNQYGIFMENGSGGFMTDLNFRGGKLGALFGNQQFTTRRLTFQNCETAITMLWDWAWTMKSVSISNCKVGLNITGGSGTQDIQGTGSILLLDSNISDTPIGILTSLRMAEQQTTMYISNLGLGNVPIAIQEARGRVLLEGGSKKIASWGFGKTYGSASSQGKFQYGGVITPQAPLPDKLASPDFGFTEMGRDAYTMTPTSFFFNMKTDGGAAGDGTTDDTKAINDALKGNTNKIIFFPHGIYKITDTILIPPGSRIVGSAWSQIMASGKAFENIRQPKVAIRVGRKGDKGIVEMQDLLFTAQGATAGLIMMEWNIAGDNDIGFPKMWDCHVRIGGAKGTGLQTNDCPQGAGTNKCMAASLMLHMSKSGNGYWENVWAWVADHDMDTLEQGKIDIFAARGILIQSQGPTWLYGTASEHCILYQYQFSGAKNIFMGMIQTESPYFQTSPEAPKPFMGSIATKNFPSDPKFTACADGSPTCAFSWALRIIRSSDIYVYGAGLYSWFDNYGQACVKTENCQDRSLFIDRSSSIWIYNLATKAIIEMVSPWGGKPTIAKDNQNGFLATILGWLGDALDTDASGTIGGGADTGLHDSPQAATIIPLAGTTFAPGQTLTLTPAIASEIANLPDYTYQNKPPGPANCQGECDFWRKITATCCGIGGTVSNPLVIPAGVDLPADIPLPVGIIPPFAFTSESGDKVPAGVPLTQPETIPNKTHVDKPLSFTGGIILPSNDPAAVIQNKSPDDVPIKPLPSCTTINGDGQFTLASSCLPAIRELPTGGSGSENNRPPGPKNCHSNCSLLRLLTGTCCGHGGLMINGIRIPKIPLPKPLRLPKGLKPWPPITIGPKIYSTISVEIEIPEGTIVDIDIPGPIPLPEGDAPGNPSDPREPGKCNSAGDCCDPEVDPSFGLCPNGNYPLYNWHKGTVDCNLSLQDALPKRGTCQKMIDDDPNKAKQEVEQAKSCSNPPPEEDPKKDPSCGKSLSKRHENDQGLPENNSCEWRAKAGFPWPGAGCDATYTCNGARSHYPNICANAWSAIDKRGFTSILTRTIKRIVRTDIKNPPGGSSNDPQNTHETKALFNNRQQLPSAAQATSGWKILGWDTKKNQPDTEPACNVEEYPFAWANSKDGRVLRLVEAAENAAQGHDMGNFLQAYATYEFHRRQNNGIEPELKVGDTFTVCIHFENTVGRDGDYNLRDKDSNMCGYYGPEFILEAAPKGSIAGGVNLGPDPWFTEDGRQLTQVDNKGKTWGPYFCSEPMPGLLWLKTKDKIKTLSPVQGWRATTINPNPPPNPHPNAPQPTPGWVAGKNLQCHPWTSETPPEPISRHIGTKKRSIEMEDFEDMSPGNMSISQNISLAVLTPRQAGFGSFLDPRAYGLIKGCGMANQVTDWTDPCIPEDICYDGAPGNGNVGWGGDNSGGSSGGSGSGASDSGSGSGDSSEDGDDGNDDGGDNGDGPPTGNASDDGDGGWGFGDTGSNTKSCDENCNFICTQPGDKDFCSPIELTNTRSLIKCTKCSDEIVGEACPAARFWNPLCVYTCIVGGRSKCMGLTPDDATGCKKCPGAPPANAINQDCRPKGDPTCNYICGKPGVKDYCSPLDQTNGWIRCIKCAAQVTQENCPIAELYTPLCAYVCTVPGFLGKCFGYEQTGPTVTGCMKCPRSSG